MPLHRLFRRRRAPQPLSDAAKAQIVADVQTQIEEQLAGTTFRGVISDGTPYEICLIDPKFSKPITIVGWSEGHGC